MVTSLELQMTEAQLQVVDCCRSYTFAGAFETKALLGLLNTSPCPHLDPVIHGVVAHLERLPHKCLHDDLTFDARIAGDQSRRGSAGVQSL